MDRVIVGFYSKTAIPIESHYWWSCTQASLLLALISFTKFNMCLAIEAEG